MAAANSAAASGVGAWARDFDLYRGALLEDALLMPPLHTYGYSASQGAPGRIYTRARSNCLAIHTALAAQYTLSCIVTTPHLTSTIPTVVLACACSPCLCVMTKHCEAATSCSRVCAYRLRRARHAVVVNVRAHSEQQVIGTLNQLVLTVISQCAA